MKTTHSTSHAPAVVHGGLGPRPPFSELYPERYRELVHIASEHAVVDYEIDLDHGLDSMDEDDLHGYAHAAAAQHCTDTDELDAFIHAYVDAYLNA